MVRWYGSSIEDQEFPIPGKMSSLGRGERAVADEELREVSMHILIRQLGKPYQEEIATFDRQFRQHPDGVDYKDVKKYRKIIRKAVIEEVKYYDVIFCTTAMATNLKVMKGTNGRIFQIIIDECGMSTEPDSMSAIIATRSQQVVLIGDHKQLRPIVMCSEAANLGLEKSLFERYASKATMLTSQYRMVGYLINCVNLCIIIMNPIHGEVYSIQHYVIKFVSGLRQVGGFLLALRFPPPIKLASTI